MFTGRETASSIIHQYLLSGPFDVGVEEEAGFSPLVGALEVPLLIAVDGFEANALVVAEDEGDDTFAGVGDGDGVGGAGTVGIPAGDAANDVDAHGIGGGYRSHGLDGPQGLEDSMEEGQQLSFSSTSTSMYRGWVSSMNQSYHWGGGKSSRCRMLSALTVWGRFVRLAKLVGNLPKRLLKRNKRRE